MAFWMHSAKWSVRMRAQLEHLRLHPQQERNRLGAAKAKQLVFVFSNRRLLKKVQAIDYEEQCWSWAEEEEEESEG